MQYPVHPSCQVTRRKIKQNLSQIMLMQLRSQRPSVESHRGKDIQRRGILRDLPSPKRSINGCLGKALINSAANFAIILFPYKSRVSSNSVTLLMSGPIAILVTRSVIIPYNNRYVKFVTQNAGLLQCRRNIPGCEYANRLLHPNPSTTASLRSTP